MPVKVGLKHLCGFLARYAERSVVVLVALNFQGFKPSLWVFGPL